MKDGILEDKGEKDYYCDVIMDEASKMNEIVKKLIVLNHLEYEKDNAKVERINLSQLILHYIENISFYLKQNNILLSHNISRDLYIWGDEFKIEEVLTNYIK